VSVPDSRLLELARLGDEAAFAGLVERHRRCLLAHCRSIVDDSAAQDAVQLAFISAWRALRRDCVVRNARGWLLTIAHRTALQLRRSQNEPAQELRDAVAGAASPDELLERRSQVRATLAAVAGLPPHERDALLLTTVHGRSGYDAARALGVSEPQVRQLVFRARGRAREALRAAPSLLGFGTAARRLLGLRRATRAAARRAVASPRQTARLNPALGGGHWGAAALAAAAVAAAPVIVAVAGGAAAAPRTIAPSAGTAGSPRRAPAAVARVAASSPVRAHGQRSGPPRGVLGGSRSAVALPPRDDPRDAAPSTALLADRGRGSAPAARLGSLVDGAGVGAAIRPAAAALLLAAGPVRGVVHAAAAPVQLAADSLPAGLARAPEAADETGRQGASLAGAATPSVREIAGALVPSGAPASAR
jgi:RNA polymerase sigma factor (sigma-70 family)